MTPVSTTARVEPARRLGGTLRLPADKSIAHRALIFAALSGGPSSIRIQSPGADVLSTIRALRSLGVSVVEQPGGRLGVEGLPSRDATVDCGNSGTTMRLVAGAVAGLRLRVTFDGDASLRRRPMERVASILRAGGAHVTTTDGHAPMTIVGTATPAAVAHELPVASAQLVGAAVLMGMRAPGETTIRTPGPTRDHTERMLGWMGVPIRRDGATTTVTGPTQPPPTDFDVPGDLSAASAWLVAAALHPDAEVTVTGVGLNPTRLALVHLLRRMGAEIAVRPRETTGPEPIGEITVRGGRSLHPVRVGGDEAADLIDELPLVAVAMASIGEPSEVRDAGELRVKESDRIASVVAGLNAIGADAEERPDGWRVRRGVPRDARIVTHGDHRIAIAFAVAALTGVASAVELDDADCVSVSYPTFWADLGTVSR